ncbi:MAG: translation initiation factor IF-2 [Elusimicrobia bacterium]|nr:translation initiation factor IF-2 [Elusimicrobiota bacterium]
MLLSDFAKKINIEEHVLQETLKTIKLKAKGPDQDLSPAVMAVLRGELEAKGLVTKEQEPEKKAVKKAPAKKSPAKKAAAAKTSAKKATPKEPVKPAKKETLVVRKVEQRMEMLAAQKAAEEAAAPKKEPEAPAAPEASPHVAANPAMTETTSVRTEVSIVEQKPKDGEETKEGQKKVFKKVTKTIITKKKTLAEGPAFIHVDPLPKKRPARGPEGHAAGHRHDDRRHKDAEAEQTLAEPAIAKRDGPLQDIEMKVPVTVGELAFKLQQKANVVLKTLMGMGIFASINQNLGADVAQKVCQEFGFHLIEGKTEEEIAIAEHDKTAEDPSLLKARAPVVTFMGHVDHGKTSLIDAIRKTKVVDTEHGGITQHISAYSVKINKGMITFLDTPGHAAFTAMRARGAHVTDLVVVVVAANEGLMPQTLEAIDHARAGNVPIVVALNKIDLPDSDPDKVKKQLMEHDLAPEDWGGKTVVVPVSAMTGQGIDQLLEMILLESEMLELKANPDKKASGIVVEAHMSPGKGAMATIIVQGGTLKEGDIVVVGPFYGKVKAMFDDHDKAIQSAGPSSPVEILGLPGVPEAGERFFVVETEKVAREITGVREERLKAERLRASSKITLEDLFAKTNAGEVKDLNIVLKADVQGSCEALRGALEKIPAENKEVRIRFIHSGVGDVNASDVILAHVSKAIVISFNVNTSADAHEEMRKTPVDIRRYNVIYDIVNDVRAALEGLLTPDTKRIFIARAEVLQVFDLTKAGIVAGCKVVKGKMRSRLNVDVMRNGQTLFTGKITTLKRFKDDVKEVGEGYECGIGISNYTDYQVGDIIEAFEIEQIARKL